MYVCNGFTTEDTSLCIVEQHGIAVGRLHTEGELKLSITITV